MNKMKKVKHTWWHHIITIWYLQTGNLIWIASAIVVFLVGYLVFENSTFEFFRLAVGFPLMLTAGGIIVFKVFEDIILLTDYKRTKVLCRFCAST